VRHIPSTLVIAVLLLVFASWPGIQAWAEAGTVHHYLSHFLYLVSGGLVGLQTAWWISNRLSVPQLDEGGVSS
jgi:hypothetical protein